MFLSFGERKCIFQPTRNDTWVVPYNISSPTAYALYRGAIRRERPAGQPALRPFTNLNHFYPVAGARRKPSQSRWTGLGAGAAGIRNTEYGYTQNQNHVKQESKIPLLKVLESLENFFQEVFKQGLGQSPKVFFASPSHPAYLPRKRRAGTERGNHTVHLAGGLGCEEKMPRR